MAIPIESVYGKEIRFQPLKIDIMPAGTWLKGSVVVVVVLVVAVVVLVDEVVVVVVLAAKIN